MGLSPTGPSTEVTQDPVIVNFASLDYRRKKFHKWLDHTSHSVVLTQTGYRSLQMEQQKVFENTCCNF